MGDTSTAKKTSVGHPVGPRERILVPELSTAEQKVHFKTFYNGIFQWSKQWANDKPTSKPIPFVYRKRHTVPHVPLDKSHKIATLKKCIEGTLDAYRVAVADFKADKSVGSERVIHQSLGHGVSDDESKTSVADFGAQLGKFKQHEFQISSHTFFIYRAIRDANDFAVVIVDDKQKPLSDKTKAQALLCFDGLCEIRNICKGVVNRIRLVTCRVGSDKEFFEQLTWVLGKPRKGEPKTTRIIVEAYQRVVEASQVNAASPFRIGLIEVKGQPAVFASDAETELPRKFLSRGDPDLLVPPDPADPLPPTPSVALKLGECRSVSHLIPPAVLKK